MTTRLFQRPIVILLFTISSNGELARRQWLHMASRPLAPKSRNATCVTSAKTREIATTWLRTRLRFHVFNAASLNGFAATGMRGCEKTLGTRLESRRMCIISCACGCLKNEGNYMCRTVVSAQCSKNKIYHIRFFFSISVVVGLKNLELTLTLTT